MDTQALNTHCRRVFRALQDVVRAQEWRQPLVTSEAGPRVHTYSEKPRPRLPRTGRLVRGLPNVEVKIQDRDADTWRGRGDPVQAVAFSTFSTQQLPGTPEELAASAFEAMRELADVLRAIPRLQTRLMDGVGYKTYDPEELGARAADQARTDDIGIPVLFEELIRQAIGASGGVDLTPSEFTGWDEAADFASERLRELHDRTHHRYEVLAFVNSPPLDRDGPVELCSLNVGDGPSALTLDGVQDSDLTRVLEYDGVRYRLPNRVAECNLVIRFPILMDVNASLHRSLLLYPEAAQVIRHVVDTLRVVRSEDLGVNLLEIVPEEFATPRLRKDFAIDYQRDTAAWLPRRAFYQGVASADLSEKELDRLRTLTAAWIIEPPKVQGFDIAMRRFSPLPVKSCAKRL